MEYQELMAKLDDIQATLKAIGIDSMVDYPGYLSIEIPDEAIAMRWGIANNEWGYDVVRIPEETDVITDVVDYQPLPLTAETWTVAEAIIACVTDLCTSLGAPLMSKCCKEGQHNLCPDVFAETCCPCECHHVDDDPEPSHNDEVLCCPDCERPNQFGELCPDCDREAKRAADFVMNGSVD